jgi:competence protein ComEA
MPTRSTFLRLSAAATVFLALGLAPSGPVRAADDFPEGPGKDALMKVCTSCHGLESIPNLKYSKQEWQGLVYQMQDNGANASSEELDAIIAYLTQNFGKNEGADKTNVNSATAARISDTLGLSGKEAAAIVAYRSKNGDFKSIDDLKKVDGVDAKKIDAAKDKIAF